MFWDRGYRNPPPIDIIKFHDCICGAKGSARGWRGGAGADDEDMDKMTTDLGRKCTQVQGFCHKGHNAFL